MEFLMAFLAIVSAGTTKWAPEDKVMGLSPALAPRLVAGVPELRPRARMPICEVKQR